MTISGQPRLIFPDQTEMTRRWASLGLSMIDLLRAAAFSAHELRSQHPGDRPGAVLVTLQANQAAGQVGDRCPVVAFRHEAAHEPGHERQVPDDHGVFAPSSQHLGETLGRIVGRQAGPGPGLQSGCHGRREQLSGLAGPGLAAVPNSRDANIAGRQETGEPLDILPPVVAQGPVGIDILGKSLSMLNQVKPHGHLGTGLADAKPPYHRRLVFAVNDPTQRRWRQLLAGNNKLFTLGSIDGGRQTHRRFTQVHNQQGSCVEHSLVSRGFQGASGRLPEPLRSFGRGIPFDVSLRHEYAPCQ